MMNERGERVKAAAPSDAVSRSSVSATCPKRAIDINAVEDDRAFPHRSPRSASSKQRAAMIKASSKVSLDDLFTQDFAGRDQGSQHHHQSRRSGLRRGGQAVARKVCPTIEVRVRTIHGSVGAITENGRHARLDRRARSSSASTYVPTNNARDMAEREERRYPPVPRHLQRHRGCAEGHEGPACAGIPAK